MKSNEAAYNKIIVLLYKYYNLIKKSIFYYLESEEITRKFINNKFNSFYVFKLNKKHKSQENSDTNLPGVSIDFWGQSKPC